MKYLDKSRPLAYGFIEEGNLHSLIKWPFTGEFSTYKPLGMALVDFIRFDGVFMKAVFDILFVRYIQAKEHKNEYNFIASVLLETADRGNFVGTNNYVTVYVLSYIHLLLTGEVDSRLLVDKQAERLTAYIRSLDFDEFDGFSLFAKRELTSLYIGMIEERQKNIEETLSMILDQRESDGLTPIQRYYELEQTNEEFRKHWHSEFVMKLGKKSNDYDVQQFVVLNNIDDMLRYELVQTLVQGVGFKRCKNCGLLFVPSGRSDSLYCDRVMRGEELPCKKIGANRQAKEKVAADPILLEHRSAYQRLNKRVEFGYMEKEEFQNWAAEAKLRRTQCQEGALSFEDYKAWLDETSLQKNTK